MTGFVGIDGRRDPAHDGINGYGAICRVVARQHVDAVSLRKFAAELMAATATACLDAGAKDVSHVKAFIEHDTGFLHADTVGNPHDVKVEGRDGEPADSFRLVVNSVIFGLSADAVKEATETAINKTVGMFGLERTSAEM
jgi:hypothetical protein